MRFSGSLVAAKMPADSRPLSSVQSWFGLELERRGIDAVIYTRYILSLLQQETFDLEQTEYFQVPKKEKGPIIGTLPTCPKGSKGKAKAEKRKSSELSVDELKKTAAIECLLSVSDEESGIEGLVDELCNRLKEQNTVKDKLDVEETTDEDTVVAPKDPVERYNAAFPALSEKCEKLKPKVSVTMDTAAWSCVASKPFSGAGGEMRPKSDSDSELIAEKHTNWTHRVLQEHLGGPNRIPRARSANERRRADLERATEERGKRAVSAFHMASNEKPKFMKGRREDRRLAPALRKLFQRRSPEAAVVVEPSTVEPVRMKTPPVKADVDNPTFIVPKIQLAAQTASVASAQLEKIRAERKQSRRSCDSAEVDAAGEVCDMSDAEVVKDGYDAEAGCLTCTSCCDCELQDYSDTPSNCENPSWYLEPLEAIMPISPSSSIKERLFQRSLSEGSFAEAEMQEDLPAEVGGADEVFDENKHQEEFILSLLQDEPAIPAEVVAPRYLSAASPVDQSSLAGCVGDASRPLYQRLGSTSALGHDETWLPHTDSFASALNNLFEAPEEELQPVYGLDDSSVVYDTSLEDVNQLYPLNDEDPIEDLVRDILGDKDNWLEVEMSRAVGAEVAEVACTCGQPVRETTVSTSPVQQDSWWLLPNISSQSCQNKGEPMPEITQNKMLDDRPVAGMIGVRGEDNNCSEQCRYSLFLHVNSDAFEPSSVNLSGGSMSVWCDRPDTAHGECGTLAGIGAKDQAMWPGVMAPDPNWIHPTLDLSCVHNCLQSMFPCTGTGSDPSDPSLASSALQTSDKLLSVMGMFPELFMDTCIMPAPDGVEHIGLDIPGIWHSPRGVHGSKLEKYLSQSKERLASVSPLSPKIWDINLCQIHCDNVESTKQNSAATFSVLNMESGLWSDFSENGKEMSGKDFIEGGLYGGKDFDAWSSAMSECSEEENVEDVDDGIWKDFSLEPMLCGQRSTSADIGGSGDDLDVIATPAHLQLANTSNTSATSSVEILPSETSAFTDITPVPRPLPLPHVHSEPALSPGWHLSGAFPASMLPVHKIVEVKHLYKSDTSILRQLGLTSDSDTDEAEEDGIEYSPDRHFRPIQTPKNSPTAAEDTATLASSGGAASMLEDLCSVLSSSAHSGYQLYLGHEAEHVSFVPSFRVDQEHEKCSQTGPSPGTAELLDDEEEEEHQRSLTERLLVDMKRVLTIEEEDDEVDEGVVLTVQDLDRSLDTVAVQDALTQEAAVPASRVNAAFNVFPDSIEGISDAQRFLDVGLKAQNIAFLWKATESEKCWESTAEENWSLPPLYQSIWNTGLESALPSLPEQLRSPPPPPPTPSPDNRLDELLAMMESPLLYGAGAGEGAEVTPYVQDTLQAKGGYTEESMRVENNNRKNLKSLERTQEENELESVDCYLKLSSHNSNIAPVSLEEIFDHKADVTVASSPSVASAAPAEVALKKSFPEVPKASPLKPANLVKYAKAYKELTDEEFDLPAPNVRDVKQRVLGELRVDELEGDMCEEDVLQDELDYDLIFQFDGPEVPAYQAVYSSDLEEKWLQTEPLLPRKNQDGLGTKPCSFFLEGKCWRADCKFAHDVSTITCRFWKDGACFKGEMCPFLHGFFSESPKEPDSKIGDFAVEKGDFPCLSEPQGEKDSQSIFRTLTSRARSNKESSRDKYHASYLSYKRSKAQDKTKSFSLPINIKCRAGDI